MGDLQSTGKTHWLQESDLCLWNHGIWEISHPHGFGLSSCPLWPLHHLYPDCCAACINWFPYLWKMLFFTFTNPDNQQMIMQLVKFCKHYPNPLYIIYDQLNALDSEDKGTDATPGAVKERVWLVLAQISVGHVSVTSASASCMTAMHMESKWSGEEKIALMGGMMEVCSVQ
jgi:hypothetical protein